MSTQQERDYLQAMRDAEAARTPGGRAVGARPSPVSRNPAITGIDPTVEEGLRRSYEHLRGLYPHG